MAVRYQFDGHILRINEAEKKTQTLQISTHRVSLFSITCSMKGGGSCSTVMVVGCTVVISTGTVTYAEFSRTHDGFTMVLTKAIFSFSMHLNVAR